MLLFYVKKFLCSLYIYIFVLSFFGYIENWLDKIAMVDFKIY